MKDAPAHPLIPRRQVLVAMSAVMMPAAAQNAERRVEVSLLPDGAVRSFEDAISDFEAVSYVVPLVAGQTLQVVLASSNAANCFDIHAPQQPKPVYVGGESGNSLRFLARTEGFHVVRVFLLRFAARDGQSARYTLELALTAQTAQVPDAPVTGRVT